MSFENRQNIVLVTTVMLKRERVKSHFIDIATSTLFKCWIQEVIRMKRMVKWTELFALQLTYTYVLRRTRYRWKTAVDIMCIIWNKPELTVRATVLVSMVKNLCFFIISFLYVSVNYQPWCHSYINNRHYHF